MWISEVTVCVTQYVMTVGRNEANNAHECDNSIDLPCMAVRGWRDAPVFIIVFFICVKGACPCLIIDWCYIYIPT